MNIVRTPRRLHLLGLASAVFLAACSGTGEAGSDGAEASSDQEPEPVLAQAASDEAASHEVDPDLPLVRVWKSPSCGCCGDWVEHMRAAGFPVEVHDVQNVMAVKTENGVPAEHASCHTATVDGYVLEGHVPADLVQRMLAERPDIEGLLVPGMPVGSPGMEMEGRKDDYDVLALSGDGSVMVYASR